VKTSTKVPTTAETVAVFVRRPLSRAMAMLDTGAWQTTVEVEVQPRVAHWLSVNDAVGVKSIPPKFRPCTVSNDVEHGAMLTSRN
jgi:hypothetical protein